MSSGIQLIGSPLRKGEHHTDYPQGPGRERLLVADIAESHFAKPQDPGAPI